MTPPFKMDLTSDIEKWRYDTWDIKEPETIAWIMDFGNGVFFDVGANIGIYSMFAASQHKDLIIISFEPVWGNYYKLILNTILNGYKNIHYFALALDEETDMKTMYLPKAEYGASGGQVGFPINEKGEIFDVREEQQVMTIKMDDFCFWNKIKPTYIKIDVDGNEERILNGMNWILDCRSLKSVLMEINNNKPQIVQKMYSLGFTDDNKYNKMKNHSRVRREKEGIKCENVVFTR